VSTEWGPSQCGCGCRPVAVDGAGCPCRECQPGAGIDFHKGAKHIVRRNQELMAAGRYEDVRWIYMVKR
jgi:hypothetical protein